MSRSLLLSSILVLTVGCAGAGNDLRAQTNGVRIGQHSAEPLVVSNADVTGPSSSLSLREDGMRGRFRDQPVDLQWDHQQVKGLFGMKPTKLALSEGDDIRAQGTFSGTRVDILLQSDVLVARVSSCAYYLQRAEGGYAGKRECEGQGEEPFTVDFPESLQQRPLEQMATLLALTLVNYTDTDSAAASEARFTTTRERVQPANSTHDDKYTLQ